MSDEMNRLYMEYLNNGGNKVYSYWLHKLYKERIKNENIYTCYRCGVKTNEYLILSGISFRCVEREWHLCPNCLMEFHEFMGDKKMKICDRCGSKEKTTGSPWFDGKDLCINCVEEFRDIAEKWLVNKLKILE